MRFIESRFKVGFCVLFDDLKSVYKGLAGKHYNCTDSMILTGENE